MESLKKEYPPTTIKQFDWWLASLPKHHRRAILPERLARDLKLDSSLAYDLFVAATEQGTLAVNYEVTCPACGDVVVYTSPREIPETIECHEGHSFSLTNLSNQVIVSFRLIRGPGERPKKPFGSMRGNQVPHRPLQGSSVSEWAKHDLFRTRIIDSEFFSLTDATYAQKLLKRLEASFQSKSTKVKQEAMENVANYLLSCVHCFDVTHNHRSETNQIDQMVRVRPYRYVHPLLEFIGTHFICECKNEEESVSVQKISNLKSLLDDHNASLGVFFSRKPISGEGWSDGSGKVRQIFMHSRKVIVCIDYNDIERLLQSKANLMTMLYDKYHEVISVSRT